MIKKYYAYLGKSGHWTVKRWDGEEWFMPLLKDALKPTTLLAAYFLPFPVNVNKKQWETLPETDIKHPAMVEFFKLMPHTLTWQTDDRQR